MYIYIYIYIYYIVYIYIYIYIYMCCDITYIYIYIYIYRSLAREPSKGAIPKRNTHAHLTRSLFRWGRSRWNKEPAQKRQVIRRNVAQISIIQVLKQIHIVNRTQTKPTVATRRGVKGVSDLPLL